MICLCCGASLTGRTRRARYCNDTCRLRAFRQREKIASIPPDIRQHIEHVRRIAPRAAIQLELLIAQNGPRNAKQLVEVVGLALMEYDALRAA